MSGSVRVCQDAAATAGETQMLSVSAHAFLPRHLLSEIMKIINIMSGLLPARVSQEAFDEVVKVSVCRIICH